ncbi:MAG: DUF938 domain-containing protein [Parvularculaceae bacterium]|nr:DUF938 domain-containing protein [Parvularculaceae bacterium]
MSGNKEIALEERGREERRLFSPSAARNRDAIRAAFLQTMPQAGVILEIGSGTGEHAVHIAAAAPGLRWLPGDPDAASRASIAAWTEHCGLANVAAPHPVDVTTKDWDAGLGAIDGIVSINMIHIAPFEAAKGLIAGAGRLLRPGGKLFLYGPFSQGGAHTAPSNEAFDASLKARDPRWGVRDLDQDIAPLAGKEGLSLETVLKMPANNLSVIFLRR